MAVSVKDFLDAIRGRFNDEPNKVEVTGNNLIRDINESILIGNNLQASWYRFGFKYIDFLKSVDVDDITFNDDNIEIIAEGVSGRARLVSSKDEPMDLSNIGKVWVEFEGEQIGSTVQNTSMRIQLRRLSTEEPLASYESEINQEKQKKSLDVTQITGKVFIRIESRSNSQGNGYNLKVYQIYGERDS